MFTCHCFAVKNLVPKSQIRFLSLFRYPFKEHQQIPNKVSCLRMNLEATRCISAANKYKPGQLFEKSRHFYNNGNLFSFIKNIHISSPSLCYKSNQDAERRKNYIFLGCIALFGITTAALHFSLREHEDYVKVR